MKSVLIGQIRRLLDLISSLGTRYGIYMYLIYLEMNLLPWLWRSACKITVPGGTESIVLRKGSTDWDVFEEVFVRKEYDISDYEQFNVVKQIYTDILRRKKKPTILDLGANIGLASIWFRRVFPDAEIYAVEPEAGNFMMLEQNLAEVPGVFPLRAGIWHRECALKIRDENAKPWAFQTEETKRIGDQGAVSGVTITQLLSKNKDGDPFIVKIDIEGAESFLFEKNTEWINTIPVLVIEIHDWLMPWAATGHLFFIASTRRKRDYIIRGQNLFCLLHQEISVCDDKMPGTS